MELKQNCLIIGSKIWKHLSVRYLNKKTSVNHSMSCLIFNTVARECLSNISEQWTENKKMALFQQVDNEKFTEMFGSQYLIRQDMHGGYYYIDNIKIKFIKNLCKLNVSYCIVHKDKLNNRNRNTTAE